MPPLNPKNIILEAHKFEAEGFILEAYRCYGEAIDLLKHLIDAGSAPLNEERKSKYKKHLIALETYYQMLENRILPKDRMVKNTIVKIAKGAVGYSYENLLGAYLNDTVKEIHIYESYLFTEAQLQNLVCFLELLLRKCKNLRFICVFTKKMLPKANNDEISAANFKLRKNTLDNLLKQFQSLNIVFRYRFKTVAHDRMIMLGNGTNISMGYGLDIYERTPKFSLGSFAQELRMCKETFVHITTECEQLQGNESENDERILKVKEVEVADDNDNDGDDEEDEDCKSNLENENLI